MGRRRKLLGGPILFSNRAGHSRDTQCKRNTSIDYREQLLAQSHSLSWAFLGRLVDLKWNGEAG